MKRTKTTLLSLLLVASVLTPSMGAVKTTLAEESATTTVPETSAVALEEAYEEKLANFEYVNPYYDNYEISYDFQKYVASNSSDTWDKLAFGYKFSVGGQQVALYHGISNLNIALLQEDGSTFVTSTANTASVKITVPEGWDDAYGNSSVVANRIGDVANTNTFEDVSTSQNIILGGIFSVNRLQSTKYDVIVNPTIKKHVINGQTEYRYSVSGKHLCTLVFEEEIQGVTPYINDADNHPDECGNVDSESSEHVSDCTYDYITNPTVTPNIYNTADDELAIQMTTGVQMSGNDKMTVTVNPIGCTVTKKGRNAYVFAYGSDNSYTEFYFGNWSNESWTIGYTVNSTVKDANVYMKDMGSTTKATINNSAINSSGTVLNYTSTNKTIYSSIMNANNEKTSNRYYRIFDMSIERVADEASTDENESYVTIEDVTYYLYNFYVDSELIVQIGIPSAEVKVFPKEIGRASTYGTLFTNYTYVSADENNHVKDADGEDKAFESYVAYDGASVRVDTETPGLRFTAGVKEELYNAYVALYGAENVELGLKLTRDDGTVAYVSADVDKLKTVDGICYMQVAVVDLVETEYTVSYTPQVYLAYRTSATASDYVCIIGASLSDNARTIQYVAQETLEDVAAGELEYSDEHLAILNTFAGNNTEVE